MATIVIVKPESAWMRRGGGRWLGEGGAAEGWGVRDGVVESGQGPEETSMGHIYEEPV